jgi:tetratricopeptide (TPR) repeat protein
MEWIDGDALGGRICGEPLSVRQAVSLGRRLCDALGEAHSRGIVHRDIKPANIILEGGNLDTPKVLDFGLARTIDTTQPITRTGGMVGTPAYMAPEQAKKSGELDARADVFALGCVLFECLAGYAAFRGPNVVAVLCKVLLEEPPWLGDVRRDLPDALAELVANMLAKEPSDRPADARAVCEALAAIEMGGKIPTSQRPSIGAYEQRYLSVILAGRPRDATLKEPPTALGTPRLLAGMRKATAPFDAEMNHLADSTVLLTLRGQGTAADRAARAARCALAVRDLLPEVPVVLATGRGLVKVRQPVGEVIDEAARLLQMASHGAPSDQDGGPVLVDAVTASLLDVRFELRQHGRDVELLAYRSHSVEPRKLLGRETPCVGRARELATLRAVWEECLAEPVARPVVVTGPSGIGKTRLMREWVAELKADAAAQPCILAVRADPMGGGGAFGMLSRLLHVAAGASDAEAPERVREKLLRRVQAHVAPQEAARVAEFLAELLGLPAGDAESLAQRAARHDPVLRGDQIRRAFQDWLAAETRAHPVLIVLEDLQWGDVPSVELIGSALRNLRDQPLCVVGLARPELEERFPRLWGDRDVTTFTLGPLRFRAAVQLVCAALEGIDDALAEQIARRSGGSPFFLEELIRAHAEGRSARAPDNLLAMLQARLDELASSLRLTLRAASIFGDTFCPAGVAALLGEEGNDAAVNLQVLLEREVLVQVEPLERTSAGELSFAQGLWREAAYATLTEQDRRLGHALAASWLEHNRPGDAFAIAEHYELGDNREKAGEWFRVAARHALSGGDHTGALERAERGIACGVAPAALGELRAIQAEGHKWRGENTLAEGRALEALSQLPAGSVAWYSALGEAVAASGKLGNKERLVELAAAIRDARPLDADAALTRTIALSRTVTQLVLAGRTDEADALLALLAPDEADPSVAGWVHEARAVRAGSGNDPGGRVEMARRAAACFAQAGDLRNACLQLTSVGFALNEIGSYAGAEESLREAIALGERMHLSNAVSTAQAQLGRALLQLKRPEQAESALRGAIQALREQGNQRLEGVARGYLARLLHQTERSSAAEDEARRALSVLSKAAPLRAAASAVLASVLLELGRAQEAADNAHDAFQALEESGSLPTGEGLVRLVRAETLLALGRRADAAAALRRAHEQLESKARQIKDEALREAFYRVPEHARTRQLHAELCATDR